MKIQNVLVLGAEDLIETCNKAYSKVGINDFDLSALSIHLFDRIEFRWHGNIVVLKSGWDVCGHYIFK